MLRRIGPRRAGLLLSVWLVGRCEVSRSGGNADGRRGPQIVADCSEGIESSARRMGLEFFVTASGGFWRMETSRGRSKRDRALFHRGLGRRLNRSG